MTLAEHTARLLSTHPFRPGQRVWHAKLGACTVTRVSVPHNSPDPSAQGDVWFHRVCSPSTDILDGVGKAWTVYCRADLSPVE